MKTLRELLLDAETRAGKWLADGNIAKEQGNTRKAEKCFDKAQFWHDRANLLRDKANLDSL